MHTKKGSNRPRRYNYFIITLFMVSVAAVAIVMVYPIEIIANLVSTCVQITIITIVVYMFRWIFPKDRANRPRMRTGRKSSVWITGSMNTIVIIIAGLVLFAFLFFIPQLVTPLIIQYLIEMGQFYGVPILAFAMLSAMLVFLQLFNLVQRK